MSVAFALLPLVVLLPLLAAGSIGLFMLAGEARGDAAERPTARWSGWMAVAVSMMVCWWQ